MGKVLDFEGKERRQGRVGWGGGVRMTGAGNLDGLGMDLVTEHLVDAWQHDRGERAGAEMPRIEGRVEHYTNIIKGWRPRYLMLRDGVLAYRKLHSKDILVNVNVRLFYPNAWER